MAASQRELQNLVISISKGILTDEIAGGRVTSLRAEQLKLQEELATIEATSNVVVLHPASADRAARAFARFTDFMAEASNEAEFAEVVGEFRSLVERIVVCPVPPDASGRPGYTLKVIGRLHGILGLDQELNNPVYFSGAG